MHKVLEAFVVALPVMDFRPGVRSGAGRVLLPVTAILPAGTLSVVPVQAGTAATAIAAALGAGIVAGTAVPVSPAAFSGILPPAGFLLTAISTAASAIPVLSCHTANALTILLRHVKSSWLPPRGLRTHVCVHASRESPMPCLYCHAYCHAAHGPSGYIISCELMPADGYFITVYSHSTGRNAKTPLFPRGQERIWRFICRKLHGYWLQSSGQGPRHPCPAYLPWSAGYTGSYTGNLSGRGTAQEAGRGRLFLQGYDACQ